MIDEIEQVNLLAELGAKGNACMLKHKDPIPKAVDYIVIPFGNEEGADNFTIPVCQECLDGFIDPKWLLIYCLKCMASQWLYKPFAKLQYFNRSTGKMYSGIILDGCPECSDKPKHIWYME